MIPDACPPPQDFLAPAQSLTAPVRPGNCARIRQTPSEFTWPQLGSAPTKEEPRRYATLTLKFPDGHAESVSTDRNWLAWDEVLPPGEYSWRLTRPDGEKSAERRFTIEKDARQFLIPEDAEALARAKAAPHPRTWTHDDKGAIAAIKAERSAAFARVVRRVDELLSAQVQPEPRATSISANYDDTVGESKRTLAAALAWAVTRNRRYGTRRRAPPREPGEVEHRGAAQLPGERHGQPHRRLDARARIRLDARFPRRGPEEAHPRRHPRAHRADVSRAHRRRADLAPAVRLARQPHAHAHRRDRRARGGRYPEADEWFRASARGAAVWTSPWGDGDGGFANGTMQAQWDTGSNLVGWYVLQNAAGIPIFQKQWVREHARYLAYFVPPGAPGNVFGDGQELQDDTLQDQARIESLVAPRPAPALTGKHVVSGPTPNAALFPSIGWVAMHSDLADPNRTSVYFKSSPYGSFNHSHADQNAFVIDSAGERPGDRVGLLRRLQDDALARVVQADARGQRDHLRRRAGAGHRRDAVFGGDHRFRCECAHRSRHGRCQGGLRRRPHAGRTHDHLRSRGQHGHGARPARLRNAAHVGVEPAFAQAHGAGHRRPRVRAQRPGPHVCRDAEVARGAVHPDRRMDRAALGARRRSSGTAASRRKEKTREAEFVAVMKIGKEC
jgi:hypothetical protein